MSDVNHCGSCGHAVDAAAQRHCPGCGEPVLSPRIDWRFLAWQLEHGVFNMDRGLLYTLRMLMFRPGRLIRDYLEGRRVGHVKPLWLVMVTAAVVVFLTSYVPGADGVTGQLSAGIEAEGANDGHATVKFEAFQVVGNWIDRNFALATILMLPLEAVIFKLAFWRVKGLNYPEWLTIIAFLTAQTFVIWSFFVLLGWWVPGAKGGYIWVALGYAVFSLVQAFNDYPRWKTVLRGLAGFGMWMVASGLIVAMAALIYVAASRGG